MTILKCVRSLLEVYYYKKWLFKFYAIYSLSNIYVALICTEVLSFVDYWWL